MYMTQSEAKDKRCNDAWRGYLSVDPNPSELNPVKTRCIGSLCGQWDWADPLENTGVKKWTPESRGRCGLRDGAK